MCMISSYSLSLRILSGTHLSVGSVLVRKARESFERILSEKVCVSGKVGKSPVLAL